MYPREFLEKKKHGHTILDPVPAFDPNPTLRDCSEIIRGAGDKTVLINTMQSPKLVAFGGAAAQQNRANVSVFYRDTARERSFFVFGSEITPTNFSPSVDGLPGGLRAHGVEEVQRGGPPLLRNRVRPTLAKPRIPDRRLPGTHPPIANATAGRREADR